MITHFFNGFRVFDTRPLRGPVDCPTTFCDTAAQEFVGFGWVASAQTLAEVWRLSHWTDRGLST